MTTVIVAGASTIVVSDLEALSTVTSSFRVIFSSGFWSGAPAAGAACAPVAWAAAAVPPPSCLASAARSAGADSAPTQTRARSSRFILSPFEVT